jgi:hypothetical protein
MVLHWWTDTKDNLSADTINIFCSSVCMKKLQKIFQGTPKEKKRPHHSMEYAYFTLRAECWPMPSTTGIFTWLNTFVFEAIDNPVAGVYGVGI